MTTLNARFKQLLELEYPDADTELIKSAAAITSYTATRLLGDKKQKRYAPISNAANDICKKIAQGDYLWLQHHHPAFTQRIDTLKRKDRIPTQWVKRLVNQHSPSETSAKMIGTTLMKYNRLIEKSFPASVNGKTTSVYEIFWDNGPYGPRKI